MKKIHVISGILMLALFIAGAVRSTEANAQDANNSLKIYASPELTELTTKWAEEFNSTNQGLNIQVVSLVEAGSSAPAADGTLSFVSQKDLKATDNEMMWKVVVGRDVMVPIVNSKNPYLARLQEKGISADALSLVFADKTASPWGILLGDEKNNMVSCYYSNEIEVTSALANFLNTESEMLNGVAVANSSEMISAIQKDIYAIGFCRLTDILNSQNHQIAESISLLPIDRNSNGTLDYTENIYQDLASFTRGVWIGKYPKALYTSIYSVSASKPSTENEVAFLKWVLTEGQEYTALNGYTELAVNERNSKIEDLTISQVDLLADTTESSNFKMILIILGITVVASFGIEAALRYRRSLKVGITESVSTIQFAFNENSVSVPGGLYFDKSHTWAFMEKDGMVKIGVDDFIQHVTGAITQIKMKNPGEKVSKGEQLLSLVHKGKQISLYAPVTGIIKESNENLKSESNLLNSAPFTEGWVYTIEPTNWLRDIQFLFMAEKYKVWLKEEFSRLKDFLAMIVKPGTSEYAMVILQDGGELKDQLLSDMAPQVWEEFQTNFLDASK